jgi:DNA topoisomerase-1
MRTDSITLSGSAIAAARNQVRELYGGRIPARRPARLHLQGQERPRGARGDPSGRRLLPDSAQTGLSGDQFRLYELIWMRTVASQMKDADRSASVTVRLGGQSSDGRDVVFSASSGRTITFHGFLKAYVEGRDDSKRADDAETRLPGLSQGETVSAGSISAEGHETKPPARYTEPR